MTRRPTPVRSASAAGASLGDPSGPWPLRAAPARRSCRRMRSMPGAPHPARPSASRPSPQGGGSASDDPPPPPPDAGRRPGRGLRRRASRARGRGAGAQPPCAADLAVPRADAFRGAVRQVADLCAPCRLARSRLGLLRHPLARPRRLLRARRLRDGHVPHAPDRPARRLRPSGAAGLHGVPELEGAAGRLVGLRPFPLRVADGAPRAGRPRLRARLVCLPRAGDRASISRSSRRR